MTEDEIIKALECLKEVAVVCHDCSYQDCGYPMCRVNVATDALDLINRQNAEIERLQAEYNTMTYQTAKQWVKEAKSEAIKEFAERLKTTDMTDLVGEQYINGEIYGYFYSDAFTSKVDNLVKEMEGEGK